MQGGQRRPRLAPFACEMSGGCLVGFQCPRHTEGLGDWSADETSDESEESTSAVGFGFGIDFENDLKTTPPISHPQTGIAGPHFLFTLPKFQNGTIKGVGQGFTVVSYQTKCTTPGKMVYVQIMDPAEKKAYFHIYFLSKI